VGDARDEENKPDIRVLQDIAERVETPIAQTVRDRKRPFIEHPDKAGRISLRRNVDHPARSHRSDEDKGRVRDEAATVFVNDAHDLVEGPLQRLATYGAKLGLAGDDIAEPLSQIAIVQHHGSSPTLAGWRAKKVRENGPIW